MIKFLLIYIFFQFINKIFDKKLIQSVLYLLESHYAVDCVSTTFFILFTLEKLNPFVSPSNVKELWPVCFQIQLNFTPFHDMHAGKHFWRFSNHDIKLSLFFIYFAQVKSSWIILLSLWHVFIAHWTKIVIVGVINEASFTIRV
jgi:hypothetical protein